MENYGKKTAKSVNMSITQDTEEELYIHKNCLYANYCMPIIVKFECEFEL